MASETQNISRVLGQIEGRLNEQSARLAEHSGRFDRLEADITAGFRQVNDRVDWLLLAVVAVGGGILAVLIGLLITLIVRG